MRYIRNYKGEKKIIRNRNYSGASVIRVKALNFGCHLKFGKIAIDGPQLNWYSWFFEISATKQKHEFRILDIS